MLPLDRGRALRKLLGKAEAMDILTGLGSWWNGYGALDGDLPREVARAQEAKLDYIAITYGRPDVERAFAQGGIPWGTVRFVYANNPDGEANMLADAVDAGATFAVINAEEGGGFDASPAAGGAVTQLITSFRARHAATPLYAAIDTRGGRLSWPYEVALVAGCDALLPMVYPLAFDPAQSPGFIAAGVADALALAANSGRPLHPILQAYPEGDRSLGPNGVLEEVRVAGSPQYQARSMSFYTVGHATDAEWQAVVDLRHLIDMGATLNQMLQVGAAFIRVGDAIQSGQAAASIAPHDRDVVRYIAALLPPGGA